MGRGRGVGEGRKGGVMGVARVGLEKGPAEEEGIGGKGMGGGRWGATTEAGRYKWRQTPPISGWILTSAWTTCHRAALMTSLK